MRAYGIRDGIWRFEGRGIACRRLSATSRETFELASVRMDRFVGGGFEMYQFETRLYERFCLR